MLPSGGDCGMGGDVPGEAITSCVGCRYRRVYECRCQPPRCVLRRVEGKENRGCLQYKPEGTA
jgi:hypothetical protein